MAKKRNRQPRYRGKAKREATTQMTRNRRILDDMSPSGTPTDETLRRNPR